MKSYSTVIQCVFLAILLCCGTVVAAQIPDGILSTITDGYGNVTSIERLPDGTPVAIVSPYGQRTTLGINGDGYLGSIS